VRPEGLSHRKTPVTPSRIETATFRLVAKCLNQLGKYLAGVDKMDDNHEILDDDATVLNVSLMTHCKE
jgi:hypothetical protein